MAQFTFEGDYQILADPQIKLVESVLRKQGFTNGKVVVEPVGQTGDNYSAHVKRFIYETEDGSKFKMVAKIAPVAQVLRIIINTKLQFNNEIVMYNSVLPKFNDIQSLSGATEDEKVRFPICYGVVTEEPYEFILLEDLEEAGFEMLDRLKPLSNESVRLVFKDLAKYHALSYALKYSEPEIYENYSNQLFNMWAMMNHGPEIVQHFEAGENKLLNMLHDAGDKYKKVIKGSLTLISLMTRKNRSYEKVSKYTVIQHGDCWSNNILFRLKDGKPVQDVMIDYQLSNESSPVTDLLHFIFNCTDHATRLKYYQEWIDYYHECLDDSLSLHGLKANRIFPKDQLDAELRRYGRLMVSLGIKMSTILVKESKEKTFDPKDFAGNKDQYIKVAKSEVDPELMRESTVMKLRERIMGIIDSAYEFGLI